MKRDDKRGQSMSTQTIILLVLGVILLVVLIVGFTMGWDTLIPFIGSNNVDKLVTSCETACTVQNVYDFCVAQRTLKLDQDKVVINGYKFEDNAKYTCKTLADNGASLGFKSCSISCPAVSTPEEPIQ